MAGGDADRGLKMVGWLRGGCGEGLRWLPASCGCGGDTESGGVWEILCLGDEILLVTVSDSSLYFSFRVSVSDETSKSCSSVFSSLGLNSATVLGQVDVWDRGGGVRASLK